MTVQDLGTSSGWTLRNIGYLRLNGRMTGLKVAVNDAEALRGHGGAV